MGRTLFRPVFLIDMNRLKFFYPFILIFGLIVALENTKTALSVLSAITVHELGHIIAIKLLGGGLIKNKMFGMGASIEYYNESFSVVKEVIILSAGPVLGLIFYIVGKLLGFYTFSNASLLLSAVNCIPVLPLDGGNILRVILPLDISDKICMILSYVFAFIISIFGLIVIFKKGNFTIFAFGVSILFSITSKTTLQ